MIIKIKYSEVRNYIREGSDQMFSPQKNISFLTLLILLVSCSNQNPLIPEELDKVTIQCLNTDELLVVDDKKILKEILKEVNNSKREGAEEMEFPEGHYVTLVTVSGDTYYMSLFDKGKSLMMGLYINSDIPNFCGKEWRNKYDPNE